MSNEFSGLIKRTHQELGEIQRVLARIKDGWKSARLSNDDLYLDGVALNLHGFYSGFERNFTHIAEAVDGSLPSGDHWHELLLRQMGNEIPEIRPAVISPDSGRILDELRRFRHVVRNVYTHNFNPQNIETLIDYASTAFDRLGMEIGAFIKYLEKEK